MADCDCSAKRVEPCWVGPGFEQPGERDRSEGLVDLVDPDVSNADTGFGQ